MRKHLDGKGIAVRRCDTFVGLDGQFLRAAVRRRVAGAGRRDGRGDAVSARLSDIIEVLDAAYPPRLAQDWDSVGLVCGDPSETVETVTVAVDATAAVVAEVPDRGLLLAHHPLLLRGVDTVAASTAKGALLHQMIRTGRALFTAHTNADAASPGVSDALADALGLASKRSSRRCRRDRTWTSGWCSCPAENADAVREAMFAAGAGRIGDYSHCSWSATGTGQFLPHDGATPAIGSVGTVEQVSEDRVEVIAPSRLRGSCARRDARRASLRGTRIRHLRAGAPARRRRAGPRRLAGEAGVVVGLRLPGARRAARHLVGGARLRRFRGDGVAGCGVRRSGRLAARRRRGRRRAGLRHRRPAAPSRRRAPAGIRGGARRRRALGQRIPVVHAGGRRAARPFRRLIAGAGVGGPYRSMERREKRGHES